MPNVVSPRQIAGTAFMGLAMLALAPPAFGQAAAPSSVIPQTLRPPPGATTAPAIPSTTDPLTPPPGAAKLVVQASAIQVDGVFPEVAGEVDALVAPFAHRSLTLEQATAASVVLAGLMMVETLGPWLVKPVVLPNLILSVASLVAPATYVFGLWRLGRVLEAFAHEGRFVAAAFEALRGVGLVLALGAVFTIAIEPGLAILLGRSRGYLIGLSAADIALGLLGAMLWGFARLFRRAARLERELDGFI